MFLADINARAPLKGNKTTKHIGCIYPSQLQLFPLRTFELLVFVEAICTALNGKNTNQRQVDFSTAFVVTYVTR